MRYNKHQMSIKKNLAKFVRSTLVQNILAYTLAIVVVSLFVWLKLTVLSDLSRETPFLFILFSVFIAAYYSGLGPGVVATLLSVFGIIYFFLPPLYSFTIKFRTDLEVIITYILVGVGVSWLLEQLRQQRTTLEARVQRRTQQLKDANDELKRSNQELEDFAYIASHDLQEPLRKILAFGDRLRSKYRQELPVDATDYIDRMLRATDRMRLLIEGLLTYARVSSRQIPYTQVSLDEVVAEVLSDMEVTVQEKQAKIQVDDLGEIEASEIQITQLFQNLVSNALKFHQPDKPPEVHIFTERVFMPGNSQSLDKYCKIVVADKGIGVSEEYLDKIFTIFQRLHGRSEYDGTGIGLAVVRRIVERHGGKISVSSTVGEGTRFEVLVPVTQKDWSERFRN